ncbi:hypothetical protein M0802_005075 [Mischocyttarus mexicanus]|nr:hypothetical protein M0802_005075 [Mischocyttarus mexicanus]
MGERGGEEAGKVKKKERKNSKRKEKEGKFTLMSAKITSFSSPQRTTYVSSIQQADLQFRDHGIRACAVSPIRKENARDV